jgi:hypothetical protein
LVDVRNPNVTVRSLIHPSAIVIQFGFIFIHINREILCPHIPVVKDIPTPVPFCKGIFVSGINVLGTTIEKSVGRD